MLFDESNKNFVRELSGLPEARIGTNDNILLPHSPVEYDLLRARRSAFCIMAKKRTGDAQQRESGKRWESHRYLFAGFATVAGRPIRPPAQANGIRLAAASQVAPGTPTVAV